MKRAVLLAAVLAASGAVQAQTWQMPTPYSDGEFHTRNVKMFVEEVEKSTGGKLKIEVHSNGSLIKHPDILRAVSTGQVAIGELLLGQFGNEDPVFAADNVPFVAPGYDNAFKFYQAQKPVLEKKLQGRGMKLLYSVAWPGQGLYTKDPVKSVSDLIALARTQPGKLTYGSAGNGSTNHLAMELFKSMAGVDIRHVPYKGGPQATTDLVAGHVNVSMLSIGPLMPYVKAQRLRVLAVTSARRSPQLPQTPTVDESGLKGFEAITWFGMLAPAATPKPVVARLADALQKVMRDPETRARFQRQGAEPADGAPAALERLIRREIELYAKAAKSARLRID